MQFIHDDTKCKQEREEEEKKQQQERNHKDDKLKKIENNIHQVRSDIEKNKDALGALENAKDFILQIKADVTPDWFEEREK